MRQDVINQIDEYYTNKFSVFGSSFKGVDLSSRDAQYIRFEQICKIIQTSSFSLLDFGCGYGELVHYLTLYFNKSVFSYLGYDISSKMISCAQQTFWEYKNVTMINTPPDSKSDYVVASGIFNVKPVGIDDKEWEHYIFETLDIFDLLSSRGFAFNILTSYSDKDHMKPHLYYANPVSLFEYCKKKFSRNVALLHDYEIYDFTILVRK